MHPPFRFPILLEKPPCRHTDKRPKELPERRSSVVNSDLPPRDLLVGRLLKPSRVKAPDGLLPGNPDLQSRFNKFQSLHLIVQFKTAQRVRPRNVILGSHEESVHYNSRQVVADKRSESIEVQPAAVGRAEKRRKAARPPVSPVPPVAVKWVIYRIQDGSRQTCGALHADQP